MKITVKMTALMLALVLAAAAFAGCAKQEAPAAAEPESPTAAPEAPATAPTIETADGLSMMQKPKTITDEMEEIIFLIDNQSGTDYSTDMVQKLELQVDGAWKEILPVHDAVTMNLISVPNGSMTEISFLFAGYYETLEHGHYRVTKTLVDDAGNAVMLCTEFDLF